MSQQRQLAAILLTDIEGYTALMQENEHRAVELMNHYDEALNRLIFQFHGKLLNNYGDGSLCTFASVANAMDFAIELQKDLRKDPVVPLRIGLHIGEVFIEGDKALGDGVNLASRVQSLGQANTILFSKEIYDKVKNRPELKAVPLGTFHFKNVQDPIEVFALANDGLTVPQRSKMEGKLKKQPGQMKKRILTASLMALVAIAAFLYWDLKMRRKFTGNDKSIAVLPFENMSNDANNVYFSDGMTDEIITKLYKIPALRVISRSASFAYRGSKASLATIGDQLNVATILSGAVQKLGNRLRIFIHLADANTGDEIWAKQFDGDTSDLFNLQSEVAELIAGHLDTKLTDSAREAVAKRPTNDLEAYDQYQQGRFYWYRRNPGDLLLAINFFNTAIRLDPHYAKAYSGLADCYSLFGYLSTMKPSEAFLRAEKYADTALQLDSTLAEPHVSKGYVQFYYYWKWADAEKEFIEAIKLNPQYDWSFDAYAYLLTATERFAEAQDKIKRARELAPHSPVFATDMAFSLYYDKKYTEAYSALNIALGYSDKLALTHIWLARVYQAQKKYPEAIAENLRTLNFIPEWAPGLAGAGYIYGITGQKAKADSVLNHMTSLSSTRYMTPYAFALMYTSLGNKDKAFEYLDKALEDRANWLVWLKLDPRWDPIRSDKRYEPLVTKIGLPKTATITSAQ
ncbi:MAG: TPR end-of-group domain-containing protein [Chitinophagales bacterium]